MLIKIAGICRTMRRKHLTLPEFYALRDGRISGFTFHYNRYAGKSALFRVKEKSKSHFSRRRVLIPAQDYQALGKPIQLDASGLYREHAELFRRNRYHDYSLVIGNNYLLTLGDPSLRGITDYTLEPEKSPVNGYHVFRLFTPAVTPVNKRLIVSDWFVGCITDETGLRLSIHSSPFIGSFLRFYERPEIKQEEDIKIEELLSNARGNHQKERNSKKKKTRL